MSKADTPWTPGPWEVGATFPHCIFHADGLVANATSRRGDARATANARLIASAPALYEALERANQFITNGIEFGYIQMPDADTPDSAHETPEIVRTALALARGEADHVKG